MSANKELTRVEEYEELLRTLSEMSKKDSDHTIDTMYNKLNVPRNMIMIQADQLRASREENKVRMSQPRTTTTQPKWPRSPLLPTWTCDDCGKEYKKLDYATQHIQNKHRTNLSSLLESASRALGGRAAGVVASASASQNQSTQYTQPTASTSQRQQPSQASALERFDNAKYWADLDKLENRRRSRDA